MCLILVTFLGGCGRAPKLVPAAGVVRFVDGGQVLAGTIEAAPLGDGPSARAAVNEEGRFALQTAGRNGAQPGRYRAVVLPALVIGHAPHGPVVDPRYANYETSGLTLDVPATGSQDLVIEVEARR